MMVGDRDALPRIVVVGGGYAGMIAALRVAGRTRQRAAVTLVNGSDTFVERIRLHQAATGPAVIAHPIRRMLRGTGVAFMRGWVRGLHPEQRVVQVETDAGAVFLPYDCLIWAPGSSVDMETVPGVREHAHALGGDAAAHALRRALPEMATMGGRLIVCGGGLTGIEAATEIAETHPRVRVSLVTRGIFGADLSERGRAHLRTVFDRLGIAVQDGADVTAVHARELEMAGGAAMPFDLCLWAGSFAVSPLAGATGLRVNARGQVLVDPFLRSVSHPSVYAVGDAAAPVVAPGAPIRMACATALPMGARAADNIAANLRGASQRPFSFRYVGRCISLGRRDGLIQFVQGDDTPRDRIITGRAAAWYKEQVCRFTVWSLAGERRWAGSYRWPHARTPAPGEADAPAVEERIGATVA